MYVIGYNFDLEFDMKGMEIERESVVTLRPDGRKGIVMMKSHYDVLSTFVLSTLESEEEVSLNGLLDRAHKDLVDTLDSDISWHVLQVKLDLEARGYIRTVTPIYQRRFFLLKLTRSGIKQLRAQRTLTEWR